MALGLRDGASAALACDDGRPGGCSTPGQALAHGYRADPDRQSAPRWPCLLPQPPKGRLRSAPWQAKGSPASPAPKPPQGGNRGSHQVRAEPRRRLYRSVLLWAVVALGSCAPFLLLQAGGQQPCTRRRTSCRRSGLVHDEGDAVPRRWRAPRRRSSSRRGRCGRVRCALWTACPQQQLPAVARARRRWRRCAGPGRPSARPSPTVGGVGAAALAPHFEPLGVYFLFALLDGRGGGDRVRRRAPIPHTRPREHVAPALARRADRTRLRHPPPPSHALSRALQLSLAHTAKPRTRPARRPRCTPAHWPCVLVSGLSSSYLNGSCG